MLRGPGKDGMVERYWNRERGWTLLVVLLTAACMRPAIVALGPIIPRIAADTGMSAGELGLLAALPILAFGAVSAFVAGPARRFGFTRLAALALAVLAVGAAARLLPGTVSLWIGTALIGVAIAVLNVLMPAIVKRGFPGRVGIVTGVYTTVLSGVAALSVAVAMPITLLTGGQWRLALTASLPVVLVALGFALVRSWRARTPAAANAQALPEDAAGTRLWTSPLAWAVTLFMGLQSAMYYTFSAWFPAIQRAAGVDETAAGLYISVSMVLGLPFGLIAGAMLNRGRDHRRIILVVAPWVIVPLIGALVLPQWMPVWTILVGLVTSVTLPVALGFVSERTETPADAARLSGMAQSVGYLLAALGPFAAGALYETTGEWDAVVWLVLIAGIAMVIAGWFAARDRTLPPAPSAAAG